jgi:hypothetical protein
MAAMYELEDSSSMKNHRLVSLRKTKIFKENSFLKIEIYSID